MAKLRTLGLMVLATTLWLASALAAARAWELFLDNREVVYLRNSGMHATATITAVELQPQPTLAVRYRDVSGVLIRTRITEPNASTYPLHSAVPVLYDLATPEVAGIEERVLGRASSFDGNIKQALAVAVCSLLLGWALTRWVSSHPPRPASTSPPAPPPH